MKVLLHQLPLQTVSQLLVKTALTELALLLQAYEFTPDELAAVGIDAHSLDQLDEILSKLRKSVEQLPPEPAAIS